MVKNRYQSSLSPSINRLQYVNELKVSQCPPLNRAFRIYLEETIFVAFELALAARRPHERRRRTDDRVRDAIVMEFNIAERFFTVVYRSSTVVLLYCAIFRSLSILG